MTRWGERLPALGLVVALAATASASAASTTRVSIASSGVQANGQSTDPSISADGRFVAFTSDATNLVPGDTNGATDVFVRDRNLGRTARVSIATGGAQSNGFSGLSVGVKGVAISENGRFVVFSSDATNLVPGDTNGATDVFVRDRNLGRTARVSIATGGAQSTGSSGRWGVAISADGRLVAFGSLAFDLVPGDTNGAHDVFVRDRVAGTTRRVSVSSGGVQGDLASTFPSISAEGRFVAIDSVAPNLVSDDTNLDDDVFVRDRVAGRTTRVSVTASGLQGNRSSGREGMAISANGRFVGFASNATNLVPSDTNLTTDVFVRDRTQSRTARVSIATGGAQANGFSFLPSMSADGRYVVFGSWAANLVPGDTNGVPDVFVRDLVAGSTTRVSIATSGAQANAHNGQKGIAISGDGRFVAFQSYTTNLVPGDTNSVSDVFVYER